ncbi:MAG TPA: AraC family transcriptional regulator [Vicinamibacteria bacterium]|nr:AraC family transcriptional regulator [Vicinamibacteria bacterium]
MSPLVHAGNGSIASLSNVAIEWLFVSPSLAISRYRCRVHDGVGREQAQPWHVIVFPHSGAFELEQFGQRVFVDPNQVLLLNAGAPYTTRHPIGGCDEGCAIVLRPDLLRELSSTHEPAVAARPQRPFLANRTRVSARAALLQRWLFRGLAGAQPLDALVIQESTLALADEVLGSIPRQRRPTVGAAAQRRQRDLVEAARQLIADSYRQSLTLDRLAAQLETSPFHLCRLFREQTGFSIHRYLVRLRLQEALSRLDEAHGSLTGLALDLGFSSHSHFTSAFRRHFGVPPSAARDCLTPEQLRHLTQQLA